MAEVRAVKQVFTDFKNIKMNGTKSMIGHSLGAAGGLEAVATIQAIRTGWVHPTINQVNPNTGQYARAKPFLIRSASRSLACVGSDLDRVHRGCSMFCLGHLTSSLWSLVSSLTLLTTGGPGGRSGRHQHSAQCEATARDYCWDLKFLWVWWSQFRSLFCPLQGMSTCMFVCSAVRAGMT